MRPSWDLIRERDLTFDMQPPAKTNNHPKNTLLYAAAEAEAWPLTMILGRKKKKGHMSALLTDFLYFHSFTVQNEMI